jgi:hypothetical protein
MDTKMKQKKTLYVMLLLIFSTLFVGCTTIGVASSREGEMSGESGAASGAENIYEVVTSELDVDIFNGDFSAIDISDLTIDSISDFYDEADAIKVTFDETDISVSDESGIEIDGTTLTISNGGLYILSGTLNDGSVIIDSEDAVQLVLDGVEITSDSSSAVVVLNAEKLILTLAENSENYIYDTSSYIDPDEVEGATPAAIYSTDDLYFNGEGSLIIESSEKVGIQSKDQVIILEGDITITSGKDGIKGKDFVFIEDGTISIESDEDGIVSTEDEDGSGYVIIEGGDFTIDAKEDGIHSENAILLYGGDFIITSEEDGIDADNVIEIHDGSIDIVESVEGIESNYIYILGGEILVASSDDGVNISDPESTLDSDNPAQSSVYIDGALYILGGYLYVVSDGDGLDSNGDIYILGGMIVVNNPETSRGDSALDANGELVIDGGTLVASGSSNMLITPSEDSTQNSITIVFDETIHAGEYVVIVDSSGEKFLAYTASEDFVTLAMSSNLFEEDETYSMYLDSSVSGNDFNGLYLDFTYTGGSFYDSFMFSGLTSITLGNVEQYLEENMENNRGGVGDRPGLDDVDLEDREPREGEIGETREMPIRGRR